MPSRTPAPPPHWENGWPPDTSRAPGTRRLWLAGALALTAVAACVTAIAVDDGRPDAAPASAAPPSAAQEDGPGLLSFPSSSVSAGTHRDGTRPDSGTPATGASGTGKGTGKKAGSGGGGTVGGGTSPTPAASPTGHGGGGSGGRPVSVWKSVRSVNYPDRSWHIDRGLVRLDPAGRADDPRTTVFKLVNGLADKACYSFATADGGYLRHRDFVLRSEHDDGSALFEKDATFCPRTSAYSGAVMLESVNYPGRYLRHRDFQLVLDPYQGSGQYRADSAFRLADAPP
ncbi:AbfB domain-containing protein [Streptomyces sp. NPDC047000]|uniref:AbfB domain-containing protein n=1 Tax=Streptomyces sp. NPDC047000 TaxID=3155474 RepID=UPI00340827FA